MAAVGERLILQSDWDEVLRESNGKAWVTYKCSGRNSTHGELHTQGLSSDGTPYVMGSEGFSVNEVNRKTLSVSYSAESVHIRRRFLAPSVTFCTVHNSRKAVTSIDVTSGGLAVSSDFEGKVKIWQTSNGDIRRDLEGHVGDVYTCRFFPSGIVVLTGSADTQLKIWSAETGQCAATITGHKAAVLDTAIVDRGRNIVSCSRDGSAKLWDCSKQQCLGTFSECGGEVNCCALGLPGNNMDLGQPESAPSEKEVLTEGKLLLLACANATLQGYGLHSRKKIFELPCHDAVNCCSFLSDVCVVCGTQDGHITVADIRNIRNPLKEWTESRSAILSVLPHKNGFFTTTADGSCFYVDEAYNTTIELTGSDCDPLCQVVSDGTHVYTACRDGQIRKYRLELVRL